MLPLFAAAVTASLSLFVLQALACVSAPAAFMITPQSVQGNLASSRMNPPGEYVVPSLDLAFSLLCLFFFFNIRRRCLNTARFFLFLFLNVCLFHL